MRFTSRKILPFWLAWLAVTAGPALAQTEVVLFGLTNSWRYNQTTNYDWTAPGFNDAALPSGRGVLGLETNSAFVQARTNTVLALGRTTYYFRTHFTSPAGRSWATSMACSS